MSETRGNSVFGSAIRAFFSALFGLLGVFVGIIVVVIVLGLITMGGGRDTEKPGKYRMLPNAQGHIEELSRSAPLILELNMHGVVGAEALDENNVRDLLIRSQQGPLAGRVHALLINMNTPGGSVFAADTIYRLVRDYRERYNVPVAVWVDGLCASGGMYISCAADKIYASPVSLVGSVGVISNFLNFSGTLDKVGIKSLTITEGKDKDLLNPLRPWKEGESEEMQQITSYYYNVFVDLVTANRPISREALVNEYGAKIFPAPKAKTYGYIDQVVDSREQALALLVKEANLDEERYQVIELEEKSWVEDFLRGEHPLLSGKIEHKITVPGQDKPTGYLYLYQPA